MRKLNFGDAFFEPSLLCSSESTEDSPIHGFFFSLLQKHMQLFFNGCANSDWNAATIS